MKMPESQSYRVFVATWNVGGKPPNDDLNLDCLLQVYNGADIYVLGFQEIVPLNAGNVLVLEDNEPAANWLSQINRSLNRSSGENSSHNGRRSMDLRNSSTLPFFQKPSLKAVSRSFRLERGRRLRTCNCRSEKERKQGKESCFGFQQIDVDEWNDVIDEESTNDFAVSEMLSASSKLDAKYSLIMSKQMVGIFVTIWAKKDVVQHIGHLRLSCVGRGIMGCFGNKGCISVSMSLHRTSICFVCSHLASGEKEGDALRRNSDVTEILKNTHFTRACKTSGCRIPEKILNHDRVIWFGDLNYRIALSYTETKRLLENNDWDMLLEKDQLKIERDAGRVFKGWNEGKIYFAPTYKYSDNSDRYAGENITSKKKRRTPACIVSCYRCDRILWHGYGISQISYVRGELRLSDHRPVCAVFSVEVALIDSKTCM